MQKSTTATTDVVLEAAYFNPDFDSCDLSQARAFFG